MLPVEAAGAGLISAGCLGLPEEEPKAGLTHAILSALLNHEATVTMRENVFVICFSLSR